MRPVPVHVINSSVHLCVDYQRHRFVNRPLFLFILLVARSLSVSGLSASCKKARSEWFLLFNRAFPYSFFSISYFALLCFLVPFCVILDLWLRIPQKRNPI
uniref:Uncharacterized protein n=1 Tax=Ciona savignyi TaxID=51511 RepID=H2YJ84_CIOSA